MSEINIARLRCEYLKNPLGIDLNNPRFGWILESNEHGEFQTAYRILVASSQEVLDEDNGDCWDTGKVSSNESIQVVYQGAKLESFTKYFWKVQSWDKDDQASEWSETAFFVTGIMKKDDLIAKWISATDNEEKRPKIKGIKLHHEPSPLLRNEFSSNKKIKRAYCIASALGEYVLYLNGNRIGDQELAPEWTDYLQKVQYQTYDVTDDIKEGKNCIGAVIADGWYMGNLGPGNPLKHTFYGQNRRFILQIMIEYEDASRQIIATDEKWKFWSEGPIRMSDHFSGETYDMNYEQTEWNTADYDDQNWQDVFVDANVTKKLVAQKNEPIRIVKEIVPIDVKKIETGKFIFDLGQNIAGWCKIKISPQYFDKNSTITLRHGEMLKEDGTLYTKNLRLAAATDTIILTDNSERAYQPSFTYHGFQFVEVSGLKSGTIAPLDMIIGCAVASDSPVVGNFNSNNETLNKLWNNILWTQRDNMISVPTDCPQRNERMGWMGDAQVFCQTSMFNMDMAAFYSKWIKDIRESQIKDGRYPDFVPHPYVGRAKKRKFSGVPAWADCGVIVPWIQYLNYGDRRTLEEHFKSMKKYVDWIKAKNRKFIWKKKLNNNYGDWLNGDTIKSDDYPSKGGQIPKKIFATLYFAKSAQLVAKIAAVLGRDKDAKKYRKLFENIKAAFNEKFIDEKTVINGDTQAGYALGLNFGLIPEERIDQAFSNLIKALKKYDNRISTGFCSTLPMMVELCRHNRSDLAYDLLLSRRFPSWFYMIDQGATTMWERWDGYVKGRGFQNPGMNSFNHYSIGAVGEWIYRTMLGINPDEKQIAFKNIILKPYPDRRISEIEGDFTSIRGKIAIKSKITDGSFNYSVEIPANTTAEIYIPTKNPDSVDEEIKGFECNELLKKGDFDGQYLQILAQSGKYQFSSDLS